MLTLGIAKQAWLCSRLIANFSMTFGVICYLYSHFGDANSILMFFCLIEKPSFKRASVKKLKNARNLRSFVVSVSSAYHWTVSGSELGRESDAGYHAARFLLERLHDVALSGRGCSGVFHHAGAEQGILLLQF